MSASFRRVALALFFPAIMLVPLAAFGDGEGDKPAKKRLPPPVASDVKYDPEGIVAISQFQETASKGNAAFMAKDYTGAVDLYRKASQLAPRNPLGPYLLAEAFLAQGNLGEADAAIANAVELVPNDPKQSSMIIKARVLFLRADIYERQKKMNEAKTAWQAYLDVAKQINGPDAGAYPSTGTERIHAIQKVLDLEAKYAPVRERIAAEKKTDAGKPATPPKK